MKKVLIIANYKGSVGGISGQVEELYRHLQAEDRFSAKIFSTACGNLILRLLAFFRMVWQARLYDVLHIHGCSEWGFLPVVYGVIAGKIWKKRIVLTYHGGGADAFFQRHIRFVRRWLSRTDVNIVLNDFLKNVFQKYGMPCIVIPNCITLSVAKEHSAYQWEAPRFVSLRHLRELYNIPCILQAYAVVKRMEPSSSLVVLGDGPLRRDLEKWVQDNKVADVTFVGQVSNVEVFDYLVNSDIMLSAPHIDNMPVSVLEAMNTGVLVISSRVGGVPYMINDGMNGILFEDGDADELARKMLEAVHNGAHTEKMILQAKQDVRQYTWDFVRTKLLPLYE